MTDRPSATSVPPATGDGGRSAGGTSVDTDAPTIRLPGLAPAPPIAPQPTLARRIRRVVVWLLLGVLALFLGLALLGAVLQATGAVPPAAKDPTGPAATVVPPAPQAATAPPPIVTPASVATPASGVAALTSGVAEPQP